MLDYELSLGKFQLGRGLRSAVPIDFRRNYGSRGTTSTALTSGISQAARLCQGARSCEQRVHEHWVQLLLCYPGDPSVGGMLEIFTGESVEDRKEAECAKAVYGRHGRKNPAEIIITRINGALGTGFTASTRHHADGSNPPHAFSSIADSSRRGRLQVLPLHDVLPVRFAMSR
jgi:hypothetical protein